MVDGRRLAEAELISMSRRRRPPRAQRTSDVTRYRGVIAAAIVGSIIAVVATVSLSTGDAPGPLARPHEIAQVACAGCHGAPTMTAACTTCHGPHPSTRARHRALVAAGALGCVDCHPGHGGGGATIATDGHMIRYGAGAEEPAGTTAFRPSLAISVPIVPASRCARCHDLASPRDPIAACLLGNGPTVCFDEHRVVRDATGAIAPRAAAWEAARDVASNVPGAPTSPARPFGPWSWLAVALAAAGLVWIGARRVGHRQVAAPVAPLPPPIKRLPVIDTSTCLGCYACVDACPYDVLDIRDYVAFVARPADCCGLILCEQKCPNGSLAIALPDEPAAAGLAEVPGVFVAGDIGGTPLIRNAATQGASVIREIAKRPRASLELDVVIIGAGPAGLAASLEAHELGLRYVTLEQATIADSIRSFPRGKLVIDPDLPNASRLWLAEATKEELLARWTRQIREVRPAIVEGRRVTTIARIDGGFAITDDTGTTHRAGHVVLAIGRRGTPRTLAVEIPATMASDVHYSLADARSFAGRRIVVVGLGDVAMEAAIALSSQPGTEVTLVVRAPEFRRGKARNIAEVRRRIASGTIRVAWQSEVTAMTTQCVTLTGGTEVSCDSVFVLIGSIPAEGLLRDLGLLPGS
jgi:thioredoxin reductase